MLHPRIPHTTVRFLVVLVALSLAGCAGGASSDTNIPPATAGVHTVMGRAFFPGGVMMLIDAHLQDGEAYGTMEYTQVQSRGDNTLRIFIDVECVGLFSDGTRAVVAGPITRSFGDQVTEINSGDWWMIQVQEGGSDMDLISTNIASRNRALSVCQVGPENSANLRAVDGDLSIH